eukprot:CAMPEP_0167805052 /NCGR_PEP_ID=MMETSP0111_2-20121227/20919_1 /TAXON_ID=91324 /ORGANISM="Lotharella globosa, Strain CCCM811" /LENGTH=169 /DNA_ID=CAMNT_0007702073 /DNA_START=1 /DNA_END=507 /DNA_ORIENTATION=-
MVMFAIFFTAFFFTPAAAGTCASLSHGTFLGGRGVATRQQGSPEMRLSGRMKLPTMAQRSTLMSRVSPTAFRTLFQQRRRPALCGADIRPQEIRFEEKDSEYNYVVDLMGMEDGLRLQLQDRNMIVQGNVQIDTDDGYYLQSFKRAFRLPDDADLDTLNSQDLGNGRIV